MYIEEYEGVALFKDPVWNTIRGHFVYLYWRIHKLD